MSFRDLIDYAFSLHRFPNKDKDKERYMQWFRNCLRVKAPGSAAVVCSKHFEDKWLDKTGQTVRLRDGAVPTLFDVPTNLRVSSLSL